MNFRVLLIVILVNLSIACTSASVARARAQTRVLFVGNSITYTNDLPGLLASFADADGRSIDVWSITGAGQTLSALAGEDRVSASLRNFDINVLILQELGGLLICPTFNRNFVEKCDESDKTQTNLALAARNIGARTFLLGTYQPDGAFGERLAENERAQSLRSGMDGHAIIATCFASLLNDEAGLEWLASDGVHPGKDLTLLYAILLYHAIFNTWPDMTPGAGQEQTRVVEYSEHQEVREHSVNDVIYHSARQGRLDKEYSREAIMRVIQIAKNISGNGDDIENCH